MNRLALITLSSFLLACSALVAGPADTPVVSISADEIHADASVLEGQQRVSSGQPDRQVLENARAAGFDAVIDLRTAGEDRGLDEAAVVQELGMSYVSLPIAGGDDVNFVNAAKLGEILDQFDGPVLMHCGSGNRVGALIALRASLNGASDDEALAAGKAAGLTRLEPVVVERLHAEEQ